MLNINTRGARADRWREHVEAQQAAGGSIQSYCRAHGLSPGAFQYWYRKTHTTRANRMTGGRGDDRGSRQGSQFWSNGGNPFLPVFVERAGKSGRGRSCPDPRWLAEVLMAIWEAGQ